jgi:hypothetical protein
MTDIIGEIVGSSGAAAKWDAIGDVRRIVITSVELRQMTEFGTTNLAYHDAEKNDPQMQFVFSGTDPDTGDEARFFVKKWGNQYNALREALRVAGVTAGDTLTGGTLAIKWTGEEPSQTKGFNNKKTWSAQYKPAAANAVTDDLI